MTERTGTAVSQSVRDDHESWFHEQVEAALREADNPAVVRVSNARAAADWQQRRAELVVRDRMPD